MPRAIKVIRSRLREHEDAQARFIREAQVLARLHHNSIVQIVDFGELENGWPYLIMEYIDGPHLDQMVEGSGPMPLASSLLVLEQITAALVYAHKQNVVHRDLKPSNVLLRAGDPRQVKVIDFGLAYSGRGEAMRLTAEGQMLGSPLYMAPEQGDGRLDVGAAADVYALGGVAYTLISGQPPFHGKSLIQLVTAHADEKPPRLSERCPQLPRFLDELLFACLAKDPAARPHADELAAHLARLARTGESQPSTPPPAPTAPPPAVHASAPTGKSMQRRVGESSISALLDKPLLDDDGIASALINQVFAMVSEVATKFSTHDRQLAALLRQADEVRSELTDMEMELALVGARAEEVGPAARVPLVAERRRIEARVIALHATQTEMQRELIDHVERLREHASGSSLQLFGEIDRALAQLAQLDRSTP
jgi:serine/threonine protein kinase